MKIVKVIAVILIGPTVGLVLGFVLGRFFLPSDPTAHGAPGDGFLLILTGVVGFIVFFVVLPYSRLGYGVARLAQDAFTLK